MPNRRLPHTPSHLHESAVRARRAMRVWRLTTKRGAHWLIIQLRGRFQGAERRNELQHQFAIDAATDAAYEFGNMKGVVMKLGQLVGFIAEGLPPEAQEVLASLQADAPPMPEGVAEQVIEAQFGQPVDKLFLDWNPTPVAAASIGQVHKAVLPNGEVVAVKVQYPGVDKAVAADLDNAHMLYALVSSVSFKSLDIKALVEELKLRIGDELDYRIEATNQSDFAHRFRHHPFIRIPKVVTELSSQRVLATEWVDGMSWQAFVDHATPEQRQLSAEVMFRFVQSSVMRSRVFNADPHPGNYRFHRDGSITFLDFGLVKRWEVGEWELLAPTLDAVIADDHLRLVDTLVDAGFLPADHGLDPERVWNYVSTPYLPYLTETFTYTREWVGQALERLIDVNGPYSDVIKLLNMPSAFVLLDRVVWGTNAILGKLEAHGQWREILDVYRVGSAPATEVGALERHWHERNP